MNRRRFRTPLRHDINVAPLVDVMLVLLVVFMVAAPMMHGSAKVDLPQESVGKAVDSQEMSIFTKGSWPLTFSDLQKKILRVDGWGSLEVLVITLMFSAFFWFSKFSEKSCFFFPRHH